MNARLAETLELVNIAWGQVIPGIPPDDLDLVLPPPDGTLRVWVDERPTRKQERLIGVKPDHYLLGIFTRDQGDPYSDITVFDENVRAVDADARDVMWHELQHALGFDHQLEAVAVGLTAHPGGPVECDHCSSPSDPGCASCGTKQNRALTTREAGWNAGCPVCLLHARLAEADCLLSELRIYSQVQYGIPEGLGGTIPLTRQRIAEARGQMAMVRSMLTGRAGQVSSVDTLLRQAEGQLNGFLSPDGVAQAAITVHKARRESYLIAWAAFANGRGNAPASAT